MAKRKTSGSQIAELAIGLVIAVPVFLALFELAMIINIAQINDSGAREASRVAAAGDPQSAQQRANKIVEHMNQDSHTMQSQFTLVSLVFDPADTLAQEAKLIPYGGTLKGDITITIKCTVHPYLVSFVTNNHEITFNAKKTCPLTYKVPNTAGGALPLQ